MYAIRSYYGLRDRIRQAKPDAKLFFTYFGSERWTFSNTQLGKMREFGMDWRMYSHEPGMVVIPSGTYGRRFSNPIADAEKVEPFMSEDYGRIGVITSYSIHYTKLYDRPSDYGVQSGALQLEVTPMEGLRLIAGFLVAADNAFENWPGRIGVITSYSIHYTKLYDRSVSTPPMW